MYVGNKIIFNTIVLYGRLIIQMLLGVMTTRLILSALGEENYGIYMLVGGTVALLSVLNSSMSNASMRYMAYGLGNKDRTVLFKTFNTTLLIHIIIGIVTIVLLEIVGLAMFEWVLNIPNEKISTAKAVFQLMIVTTYISVVSVPFDAVINAHEDLLVLSLADLLMSLLHLLIALYLSYCNVTNNVLVIYSALLVVNQLINRIVKQLYARKKYTECRIQIKKYYDSALLKEILHYTFWGVLGSLGALAVTKAKTFMINVFFGVKLNAGEGISTQVTGMLNTVSVNLTRAINPLLNKSEGGGDREKMIYCTICATKYSSFLYLLFGIPLLLEANTLLELWLKNVPEYAAIFCQLAIIGTIVEKFTFQIGNAIRAVGKVAAFSVIETIMIVLYLPIAYIFFKKGASAEYIYIISIVVSFFTAIVRLYFGKKVAGILIRDYIIRAIKPVVLPLLGALVFVIPLYLLFDGKMRFIYVTLLFMCCFSVAFFFCGMECNERRYILNFISAVRLKIKGVFLRNLK